MADIATWAWIGGSSSNITAAGLSGALVPLNGYENIVFNDRDGNGQIGDLDGTDLPSPGEGVTINDTFYQFQQLTAWRVTVKMADNTEFSLNMHVHRLDDDTLYYRLNDPSIATIEGAGYSRGSIVSIALDSFDSNFENIGVSNHSDPFPLCFCAGTRIRTVKGEISVENLKVGDLIITHNDHEPKAIQWIWMRHVSNQDLMQTPKLRPVRISAGALGDNLPRRDLLVSPQHRMVVRSKVALRMFSQNEVLVAAKRLCEMPGIFVDEELEEVIYFHIMFEDHEIVYAESAPSESFLPGPNALSAIDSAMRDELYLLFPNFIERAEAGRSARHIPAGKLQKQMICRIRKNAKVLLEC